MKTILKKFFSRITSTVLLVLLTTSAHATNPYLPLWEHIPDGEPYVFEDPDNPGKYRVYIYGSHDTMITEYCGREQVVWSAPVEDLLNWRYDGVILDSKYGSDGSLLNTGGVSDVLYAPDVTMTVDKNNKKTYWLYPNVQNGGRQGLIAKSDRPDGPFIPCNWDKNNPKVSYGVLRFDPGVFVDDDGRVYGYWGFETSYAAELDPNTMCTIKPGTELITDLISSHKEDGEFRFFEASSMRKIKDKYVLIYSRITKEGEFGLPSSNYTLAYAYSDNPLGPFTYGGTIIDGRARGKDADGNIIPTASPNCNTHGSIVEINNQWWVFYHRKTGKDEYSRQAMVAPIEVSVQEGRGGKVTISEGEYTSEGFEINGLKLFKTYPAGIACYYTGPSSNQSNNRPYPYATHYFGDPKNAPSDFELKSTPMVNITHGSVVGYKYFNFDTSDGMDKIQLAIELMPRGIDGVITIMVGSPFVNMGGIRLGSLSISKSDPMIIQTRQTVLRGINKLSGKQAIYFVFNSSVPDTSICDLFSFGFKK